MTKKQLEEEIARLRERIAVLEARPQLQPQPVIINPFPWPQPYSPYPWNAFEPSIPALPLTRQTC